MEVIQPSLFLVMGKFPERKSALREVYRSSESFRLLCRSYQKCSEAVNYWKLSEREEAPDRYREYAELFQELELDIIQSLEREGYTQKGGISDRLKG